jgi:hypothetical protein
MTFYMLERSDGSVAIMNVLSDDTDVAAEVERYTSSSGDTVVSVTPLPDGPPQDRYFRNAWKRDADGVVVDMVKARDIQRGHLRRLRTPLLAKLDVDYMLADENGNGGLKATIAAKKRALRDVTADPALEKASTPEALKAVIPDVLRAS